MKDDRYEDLPRSKANREYLRDDDREIHHMGEKPSRREGNIEDLSEEELVRRIEILKRKKRELKENPKKVSHVRREPERERLGRKVRSQKSEDRGQIRSAYRDRPVYRDRDNDFEDKRERFVSGKSSGSKGIFKTVGVLVLILGVVGGIFFSSRRGPAIKVERSVVSDPIDYSTTGKIEMIPVKAEETGDSVVVSLDDVKKNKLVGFEYSKVTIPSGFGAARPFPLVAYIAPSGKLVTGVSLCEPCKSTLFYIDSADQTLTCKACGTKWNLETLEGISGGCPKYPPDEFQHEIKDGKIYIKASGIASWKPRI